jgi:hydrogenase/urease accessory protein HupE
MVAFLCLVGLTPANADEFRPALLEISETQPGRYSVTWKAPMKSGRPLALIPVFPDGLSSIGPPSRRMVQGNVIQQTNWTSEPGALIGNTIRIDGLSGVQIDVILRLNLADGSEHSAILRPASPSFQVPVRATRWMVISSYWKIGTIHILEGFDHLLFVLALLLIIPNLWMLVKTITAFTVSHSISLALATLGVITVPGPPTEAVIALSILLLAVEIVHRHEGRDTLTIRLPWIVALSFGLVHGLGFAGALAEVGLPRQDIPLALLMFNVGVETGQLLFVGAVLAVIAVLKKAPVRWPSWSWRISPYAIGSVAAFWTVERLHSFF